jgi:hypothetical protein
VELASGKVLQGVEVQEARPGKVAGTVSSLTIVDPVKGTRTTLGAVGIKRISGSDGAARLVYDAVAKTLVHADVDNLQAIREAAQGKKSPPPERKRKPKQPAETEADQQRRKQEEAQRRKQQEAERRAHFQKTGVWLWPELTDEEQKAAVEEEKKYLDEVGQAFSMLNMRLYETERFLFFSDMPPPQVALYAPDLDKMYQGLCKAFGIPSGKNIWRGKAVVVAFLQQEAFLAFEKQFFKNDAVAAQGIAHQDSEGRVIIACCRGSDPVFFATMLVHETAHGFIHRYKSAQHLPAWLNEGAADWIAAAVVIKDKEVKRRQQEAILQMRQMRSLGGNFFNGQGLARWQYGAASSMTDFLIRSDPKRYRELIEGIKSGLPWQESLQKSYGLTPEELALRYGMAIGVPGLRP